MPDDTATRSMMYGRLTQTHPDYDPKLLEKIEDLYVGGFRIVRKAKTYLLQLPREHTVSYDARCNAVASYQPYFGTIVDQFAADLFGQPLEMVAAADANNPNTPGDLPDKTYYPAFARDCDKAGTPFADMMKNAMTTALKKRCALICVDAPKPDPTQPPPVNKAEEEARGATDLYVYELPVEQLIDWKLGDQGRYEWAIVAKKERERANPMATRDDITETFDVWTMSGGVAVWDRFSITYDPNKGKKPIAETPVPRVDGGRTEFSRIPILRFELPEGLWVGNKIGPQALEHYQRRSLLLSAEGDSLVTIPFVKLGSELGPPTGDLPAEVQQNPARGDNLLGEFRSRGFLTLGADDSIEFAEPTGKAYEIVDKQLDGLREAMFSVNHQMAASIRPTGHALGRSGLSKQKDEDATARVLRELGRLLKNFARTVYDTISSARKETVIWAAHGLDGYEAEDREQVLEESVALDTVQIPSVTFRKTHKKMIAKRLLKGQDSATLAQIDTEIDEGVEAEQEIRDLADEAKVDAIKNPPPPVVMAPKAAQPPNVKQPTAKQPGAA